jgi:hypothetical protein
MASTGTRLISAGKRPSRAAVPVNQDAEVPRPGTPPCARPSRTPLRSVIALKPPSGPATRAHRADLTRELAGHLRRVHVSASPRRVTPAPSPRCDVASWTSCATKWSPHWEADTPDQRHHAGRAGAPGVRAPGVRERRPSRTCPLSWHRHRRREPGHRSRARHALAADLHRVPVGGAAQGAQRPPHAAAAPAARHRLQRRRWASSAWPATSSR